MKKQVKRFICILLVFLLISSGKIFAEDAKTTTGSITITNPTAGQTYKFYKIFDLTASGKNQDTGEYSNYTYTIDSDWVNFFFQGDDLTTAGEKYLKTNPVLDANTTLSSILSYKGTVYYINLTDGPAFAKDAFVYADALIPDQTETAPNTDALKITLKDYGYYLVYPAGSTEKDANGTICSLTNNVPDQDVNIKSALPDIEKNIYQIIYTTGWVPDDKTTVHVGDTVYYEIIGKVPDTTGYTQNYIYQIQDTLEKGHIRSDTSFEINIQRWEGDVLKESIEVTPKYNTAGQSLQPGEAALITEDYGFTLTFNMAGQPYPAGWTISVSYYAPVIEAAVVSSLDSYAQLVYSSDPTNEAPSVPSDRIEESSSDANTLVLATQTNNLDYTAYVSRSTKKTTSLATFNVAITKEDVANTNSKLSGAEFVLKKGDKYYCYNAHDEIVSWQDNIDDATPITTDENGKARFIGIAKGTYTLVETKAPGGYSTAADTTFTIEYDDTNKVYKVGDTVLGHAQTDTGITEASYTYNLTVQDKTGGILPNTGGIGVIPIYILAALMLAGAGILFMTKKRTVK